MPGGSERYSKSPPSLDPIPIQVRWGPRHRPLGVSSRSPPAVAGWVISAGIDCESSAASDGVSASTTSTARGASPPVSASALPPAGGAWAAKLDVDSGAFSLLMIKRASIAVTLPSRFVST